jgi:hypothetical protein
LNPAWAAIIAAAAAIASSILTSFVNHQLEQQHRSRDYDIKWLEERFGGAFSYLGTVLSAVGSNANTPEGRKKTIESIHAIVDGPTKETNPWYVALMLDPENTGLRNHVYSAMAYARIQESAEVFTRYWAEVTVALEALANEYSRQRQAIIRGESLQDLISERKTKAEQQTQAFKSVMDALRTYLEGESDLDQTLPVIENSQVRGLTLALFLKLPSTDDPLSRERMGAIRRECQARGWIPEHPLPPGEPK